MRRGANGGFICNTKELHNGGPGIRFAVKTGQWASEAFAIRFGDQIHAFMNRCPHKGFELDMVPGRFFDNEKRFLICSTHGAAFEPDSGKCIFGPCIGGQLTALSVAELDQKMFLTDNAYQLVRSRTEVVDERER